MSPSAPLQETALKHVPLVFLNSSDLLSVSQSDAYLITFWFILFFFLRDASMRWLWEPLARRAGISKNRSVVRFAEQSWTLAYEVVFWSLGTVRSACRSVFGCGGRS